jgi:hypothetical protein
MLVVEQRDADPWVDKITRLARAKGQLQSESRITYEDHTHQHHSR